MIRDKVQKVLSIGQCSADNAAITRMLKRVADCNVDYADSFDEIANHAIHRRYDLILINRILDSSGASGIELISMLKSNPVYLDTPTMLISNFPDAQDAAEELGAMRGFGKSELNEEQTASRIRQALTQA